MRQWVLKRKMKKAKPLYIVYEGPIGWDVTCVLATGKFKNGRPTFYYEAENGTILIRSWKIASKYPTAAYFYNSEEAVELAYFLRERKARVD